MSIYTCSICGFTYDEAKGLPDLGIKPGTKWEDIPDDFNCPMCGAPKSVFEKTEDNSFKKVEKLKDIIPELNGDLFPQQLSIVFSNLAKGCEKEYKTEEQKLFLELSEYFDAKAVKYKGKITDILDNLAFDLNDLYPTIKNHAIDIHDRAALRALTWSEKVTGLINSLILKYKKDGNNFLNGSKIYVCEICGFIYIGDDLPEVCPVCKVPKSKIHEVK